MPELGTLLHSRKLMLSLSLLLFSSLILITNWLTHPRNRIITETEFVGIIFHKNNAPNVLGVMLLNDREVEAYWIPSKREILGMENQLELYIQEYIPALAPQLSAYKRQYFGFTRDGKQEIFIIGFYDDADVDWRKELVSMPEGADCYFEAQYDVTKDRFFYVWKLTDR